MAVSTARSGINPELQEERNKATLNVTEVTNLLDGGKSGTKRRKQLEKLLFSDPVFRIRDMIYMSNSELYRASVALQVKLFQMRREQNWTLDDYMIANRLLRDHTCCTVHHMMFIPAIENMGTEEQKRKWLPLAQNYKIIGAYAQTEMGHGTNLRELETTATFDSKTDEFVLNTPNLSSIKFWPGALGKTTNHAVVFAQLVINGRKFGLAGFMLQIRSFKDHTFMPGIKCGVIGPRMGENTLDNGFLQINNVRIPRENMLMKNQQVSRSGEFTSRGPDKANYATMLYVRVVISRECSIVMGTASTAAIRYSAVRRQSTLKPGTPEMKVLDYQTQQYKLFPALATSYAFFFVSKTLGRKHKHMMAEVEQGNYQNLQELHIMSSGIKALGTDLTTAHAEICRRACGGHGYLRSAGLADYVVDSTNLVTVEGENTVLYLQVARFLMKQMTKSLSGQKLRGSTEYLSMDVTKYTCPLQKQEDCRNVFFICDVYRRRAFGVILRAAQRLQRDITSGCDEDVAMNNNLQPMLNAAMAHSYVLIANSFAEGLNSETLSAPVKQTLGSLCCLFLTHYIEKMSGEFLESEAIGLHQLSWLQTQELQLLAEIRPNAVALVDAFDIHDETLCSTIGSYDGWAYERLYESAVKDPLNKNEVDPSYFNHLRKLMTESVNSKL